MITEGRLFHALPADDGVVPFSVSRVHQSGKRAREGDELVGFLKDSQSAEVVEVGDLEEKEPLNVSTVQRKGWGGAPPTSMMVVFA